MNAGQFKRVKFLLTKNLVSDLEQSEKEELETWRRSSPANENLYMRLSDKKYLAGRYREYGMIRRKENENKFPGTRFTLRPAVKWTIGIAATAALFFAGYYIIKVEGEKQMTVRLMAENTPGVLLSIDNKSVIDLSGYNSGDKIKNSGAVKEGNKIVYGQENTTSKDISVHTLSVPQKQIFSVVLPDGSKVWLDSKSKMTYPTSFAAGSRDVALSGEGYFEITKNPKRPFTVTAGGVKIKVTGTRFNLKAYSDDKKISAVLMDGKISFSYRDQTGAEREVPMHSGELSVLDNNSRAVETTDVNASLYNSWIDGVYFFDSETLEDIMNDLGRYYNLNVVFVNEDMRSRVLSGKLHFEKSASVMLNSFKKIIPEHIRLEGKTIIIF